METKEANITQFLDLRNPPFRQSFLDYSYLPYADVLDAIAISIALYALTAIVVHLSAAISGMSTRSLSVRSMLEGTFLSEMTVPFQNVISKKFHRRTVYFAPRITAFCLLLILLVAEALFFFSQSNKYVSFNMEDLQIRKPQFMMYDGATFSANISRGCTALVQSKNSIVYKPFSFCVTQKPIEDSGIPYIEHGVYVSVTRDKYYNMGFLMQSSNETRVLVIQTTLHSTGPMTKLNSSKVLNDPSAFVTWMIDRISVQKNCSQRSPTMFSIYPDDLHVYDANASRCVGNQNELLDTTKGLFLSTLSLSDEFLSADDFLFYSVPKNHSEWPLGPVKTSKRSDLDHYAGIETVLVRGYVLWLIAICLLAATLIAGLVAPDVELARSVAAAEYLNMECVPLHSPSHVSVNN